MVILGVVVVILEEQLLVHAVTGERNRCYSETGEQSFEAVPAGERTGVAPRFATTANTPYQRPIVAVP